ncbi:Cilia- and flagella-associated protein 161-like [Homarus americanus]|uniref:Cilia- and flagella-associated protein 161-like n=1 Tax=Homarus americanus TaxID=6706 RepID=A0A8J5MME1_HOMAM|nr:Cilia- and flagella-associated protein 161-like [Homarus americanus]
MEAEVSVCPDGLLHFGDSVIIHVPVVQPHKGQAPTHKGHATTHKGQATTHKGQATTHKGQATTHKGHAITHKGHATTHKGHATTHKGQATTHKGQATTHKGQATTHKGQATTQKGAPRPAFPCTITATPTRQALMKNQYQEAPLTASPDHHQPVIKNVFTILPRRSSHALGSALCYGDPFDLVHLAASGERMYVTSPVGSALHSGRESRRQEVLLMGESSAHSAWRLQPSEPELRLTYEGQPAEVGARVRMIQTMTNQPLVVEEEFHTNTIFGQEQEVSVGVVTRATTRAASVIAFLTWTRRTPQPDSPLKTHRQQEEGEEQEVITKEEDVLQEEREKQEKQRQEEEEKKEAEERQLEERVEGLRLVLDNESDASDQGDDEAR